MATAFDLKTASSVKSVFATRATQQQLNGVKSPTALNEKARQAGTTLNALLRASTVKDYEAAVAALNAKLERTAQLQNELAGLQQTLADRSVMNWETAQQTIEKYGGSLETLGKQFEAAKLQADWKSVWDDWQTLIDMGADVGGVLGTMADEISEMVQRSIKFGTEIPEQFKPLIEELIRTGKLLDENGDAITDMGQLKFGAPLVSEVDKIIAKIDELIKTLQQGLAPAFENLGRTRVPPIDIPYRYRQEGESPTGGEYEPTMPGYASGALITREHVARVGEGGQPELIGPIDFMREALAGALASFDRSAPATSLRATPIVLHNHFHVGNREVAREVIRVLPSELALEGM